MTPQRVAVSTAVALLFAAGGADAVGEYPPAALVRAGGASGGDALVIPEGDVTGVRNVQGGTVGDPNLDVGAGSSERRGTLSLNYDVGRCVVIFDGRKRPLARFCPGRIVFYVKPRVR